MRLWSLHPRCLDPKGLVALWREALLARKVLAGRTRGYRHHPQLERFRARRDPVRAIDAYLTVVWREANARGYRFDATKFIATRPCKIPVTSGQLEREWQHLRRKLVRRNRAWLEQIAGPALHPCFRVVPGDVEPWERAG
jgi:hypothetical protein